MHHPDLFICSDLPPTLLSALEVRYTCHLARPGPERERAIASHGTRVTAVVGHGGLHLSPAELSALPLLEIIAICGVGYDGISVDTCAKRGISVTHTPDVLTDDVADIALALVLMTSRQLGSAMNFLHQGHWDQGPAPLTQALRGKRAGILGLGRIGMAIASRLQSCGLTIHYTARTKKEVPYAHHPSVMDLARQVDFLIIACPGGPSTHHLVDAQVLHALGPHGTLINIARGSVVDESALIHALETHQLRSAGLDVFTNEPHVPSQLRALPQVVLLPHVGSSTAETRAAMSQRVLENLDAHHAGQPLPNLVPELR